MDSKNGCFVKGFVSVNGKTKGSFKAIRCMSVEASQVYSVIYKVLAQGRTELEPSDIMGLEFDAASKGDRGILKIIDEVGADSQIGWVPTIDVLYSMENEFYQFLAFLNKVLAGECAGLTRNNGAGLTDELNSSLTILSRSREAVRKSNQDKLEQLVNSLN